MNAVVAPDDVARFGELVARRLGLRARDETGDALAGVLHRRAELSGRSCRDYLGWLEADPSRREIAAVAQELTVPETYFFRDARQLGAFTAAVIPERMRARAATRTLRILSAGCASGEEPYSLAILVRTVVTDPRWVVSIRGVDVNPAALERAARGRYSAWALRETSADLRQRWFRPEGRDVMLDPEIRGSVTFEQRNLAEDDPELWPPAGYDVIFCRNVLMYFTPEGTRAVVARLTQALAPGGFLFLGHAETLRGLSTDLRLRHTHDAFYYQREGSTQRAARPPVTPAAALPALPSAAMPTRLPETVPPGPAPPGPVPHGPVPHGSAPAGPAPAEPLPAPVAVWSRPDLTAALELLRTERIGPALETVRAMPPRARRDPDVMVLHAVLLATAGRLADAEQVCVRLLDVDRRNAGAHHVLASCREGSGDRQAAIGHHRMAARLDPCFAMPRLRLGMLAGRAGEYATARRELVQALTLLSGEDTSRVLLFGGGFSRAALVTLCRNELRRCGGEP